ncbi:MAG: LuxR family transcriptional regulator [Chthoniobacter sp. 12-60-6]|nr:MAG: LuxR family transcriptional regulator [Chthoniobacter sp. 12-60-6]
MKPDAVTPFTVWIIEDNEAFRTAALRVIGRMEEVRAVRGFKSCEAALRAFEAASPEDLPGVVLLDIGLPGMSGLDGIPLLKQRAPTAQVLVLTVFDDAEKVFRAICAGADGYLLKGSNFDGIREALLEARAGGAPMNGRIARLVLRQFAQQTAQQPDYALTAREREILDLIVQGLMKKEIAGRLALSFHTVDWHLRHIYEKLQVTSRSSAVAKVMRDRRG